MQGAKHNLQLYPIKFLLQWLSQRSVSAVKWFRRPLRSTFSITVSAQTDCKWLIFCSFLETMTPKASDSDMLELTEVLPGECFLLKPRLLLGLLLDASICKRKNTFLLRTTVFLFNCRSCIWNSFNLKVLRQVQTRRNRSQENKKILIEIEASKNESRTGGFQYITIYATRGRKSMVALPPEPQCAERGLIV